jgi:hypothetical protein
MNILKNKLVFVAIASALIATSFSLYEPIRHISAMDKLSILIEETINSCYYETYLTNETMSGVGNVCDDSMHMIQQLCLQTQLEVCKNELLNKYMSNMGHAMQSNDVQ